MKWMKMNEKEVTEFGLKAIDEICVTVYLDKVKSFKDPTAFVFDLRPLQTIKEEVIKKLDYLKMTIEPERTVTWRCNWCPHKAVCNPPMDLKGNWS